MAVSQDRYLEPGIYEVSFYASPRPTYLDIDNQMTASLGDAFVKTAIQTHSGWQSFSFIATITTPGVYPLTFLFTHKAGCADTATLLTGISMTSPTTMLTAITAASPTSTSTAVPTAIPTASPTSHPTAVATSIPTASPTSTPTAVPTSIPTASPTSHPTAVPTSIPTASPTSHPTAVPSAIPTASPTSPPTAVPTAIPTASPTSTPTAVPSAIPTASPTSTPTAVPASIPAVSPTITPSSAPTSVPTAAPSSAQTLPPKHVYAMATGTSFTEAVYDLCVDTSGNVYAVDACSILMIAIGTGVTSVVAGTGKCDYSGDRGAATSATLMYPQGVAVDTAGNLFIADTNNDVIRKVTASTGFITTVAGTRKYGHTGDGELATSATFGCPTGVAVDTAGNLYIADYCNHAIRKVTASSCFISTVVGNGMQAGNDQIDGTPAGTTTSTGYTFGIAVDSNGYTYFSEYDENGYSHIKVIR